MLILGRIIALMLGRMKMSIEEAEKDYCDLLRKLFLHSNVTQEIRHLLNDDEQADTAYDLMRKIRSLTKGTAEFDTKPIKEYFRGDLKLPDILLKDPSLDTLLSPCKV
jgi:hypothetical protein